MSSGMSSKEKITVAIAVLALSASIVSLYFSVLQESRIEFECGRKMEIYQYENADIDVYLPFSFTNGSPRLGNVTDVKLTIESGDRSSQSMKHWNEFWQKVPEVVDSTKSQHLVNRPLSQTYTLPVLGNSAQYRYINFYPLKAEFKLEQGVYNLKVEVQVDHSEDWISEEYSFEYTGDPQVLLNPLNRQ